MTEPITYNGSIAEFRGWMDMFFARHGDVATFPLEKEKRDIMWKKVQDAIVANNQSNKNDIVNVATLLNYIIKVMYSPKDKDINREVWYVGICDPTINPSSLVPNKWATILAIEQLNKTTVEFLDGVYFRYHAPDGKTIDNARGFQLGEVFSKYSEMLKGQWEKDTNSNKVQENADQKALSNDEIEKELAKIPGISVDSVDIGSARITRDEKTAQGPEIEKAIIRAGFELLGTSPA